MKTIDTMNGKKGRGAGGPLSIKSRLMSIKNQFQKSLNLENAIAEFKGQITQILQAEDIRIYKHEIYSSQISSQIRVGEHVKTIYHTLSPDSIAGYTALRRKIISVSDVKDSNSLSIYHPQLKFDRSYDKFSGHTTRSILSIPLLHENADLGVVQIINKVGADTFDPQDEMIGKALAKIIAQRVFKDLNIASGPFEHLARQGKITPDKLKEIQRLAAEKQTWVTNLLRSELGMTTDEIGESLEQYYRVPFMKYDPAVKVPYSLIEGVSRYYLKTRLWVPVSGDPDKATVLMHDPRDQNKIAEIHKLLKVHSYEFRVGLPEDIIAFLGDAEPEEKEKTKISDQPDSGQVTMAPELDIGSIESESSAVAVKHVNNMIVEAHKIGASDIHIEPGKEGTNATVRMRVDGICQKVLEISEKEIKAVISRIKIISNLDIAERRKPQDGKAKLAFKGNELELRVATVPTVNGENVVLRLLTSSGALPFEKLNLSEGYMKAIKNIIARPHGLFLVVGPTGSGKTTTLHAILDQINTPEKKIWTAEDPVEITQPGLQQVQIKHKIGLDFAAVMRSFLRADPDVILIGEMRDFETANIGVESSLTGHLVFSTLHTNSAPETIIRLLDLGLDPFNFSDALLGILAQRLVRTLCPSCKEPYKPSREEFDHLRHTYGGALFDELQVKSDDILLPKPVGCDRCGGTGYRGRTGIHELLVTSNTVKRMISQKKTVDIIREQAIKDGMRTLIQDGIAKIIKGDIDLAQLHYVAAE
jgi:type II secretory ATPase GspE/PulE/Tfp pilus assembly ATPase PilB-like protein